jgi:hypothetical protein
VSFGTHRTIEDLYGQDVAVNVDEGDAEIVLSITASIDNGGSVGTTARRRVSILSSLTAAHADDLAEQLRAAAAHARTLTPHE